MRTRVSFLELSVPAEAVLSLLGQSALKQPADAAILTRCEFGVLPRLVEYSFLLAFKSFQLGRGRAKSLGLEWLLFLAGTRSIEKALDFTQPRSRRVMLASSAELPPELLASLGRPFEPPEHEKQEWISFLCKEYGFSKKALETYSCEDLAVERSTLSLFE